MIIIERIKYNERFVSIEFDNGEALKLPLNLAGLFKLQPDQEIDMTKYRQLKEESMRFECRQKALKYLAMRSRSKKEIATYLKRKKFDSDIINECVQGLETERFLDDREYARQYVRNKISRKTVGKNLLIRDLMQKGISRKIINSVLKENTVDADFDSLLQLARKKYHSLGDKKNRIYKLSYFLHQRGFDNEEIRMVIDRIIDEEKHE